MMKILKQLRIVKYYTVVTLSVISFNILNAQTIEQGIKLIDREKFKEAKANFELILKSNPKSAEAYYYLGELSIIDSQLVEAQNYFQKGIEADKEKACNYIGQGHIKLLSKDTTAAQKIFEDALDMTDYKDGNAYLYIADAYIRSDIKIFNKAIDWLLKAKGLKDQKKNPNIYYKLAELYNKVNNGTLARENFQNAVNCDNNFIKGYLGVADIYLKIKNYSDAQSYFDQALKVDTNYAPTYFALYDFYYMLKNYDKAADAYKKYIDLSEASVKKSERYATVLYLAKNYKTAIDVIKGIENEKVDAVQTNHILAYSYYALEDFTNGIPVFKKYFSISKQEDLISTDFQYYAKLLALSGDDTLAINNYKKAITLDSSLTDLHGDIAVLYAKQKKYTDAANEYELKEKANKKLSVREYFDWGRVLMASRQFVKADSTFSKLVQLQPDLPLGYYMRAAANSSIDTTSELGLAKPHYEKFIELAMQTPDKYKKNLIDAYSYLGFYYFIKREDPAFKDTWKQNYIDNWQKVLAIDPENAKAKNAMDNLKLLKK